jgi:quercetin dioxygenase-like cupin family protein
MNKIALFVAAAAALFATSIAAQENIGRNAKVTLVFDQELPNAPGKSLRVVLVDYGPGGGSPSHRHPSRRHSSMRACWRERSAAK